MPTYDYQCTGCEHAFEAFQSITAAPLKKCPECGKNKLRRLIGTGAALLFKGEGFYITDYRSESYKQAAQAESGAGASKDGDASAKPATGDNNPATTTETKAAAPASAAKPKRVEKPTGAKPPARKR